MKRRYLWPCPPSWEFTLRVESFTGLSSKRDAVWVFIRIDVVAVRHNA